MLGSTAAIGHFNTASVLDSHEYGRTCADTNGYHDIFVPGRLMNHDAAERRQKYTKVERYTYTQADFAYKCVLLILHNPFTVQVFTIVASVNPSAPRDQP